MQEGPQLGAQLVLADPDLAVVDACKRYFNLKHPEVEIVQGKAFETDCDAFACPGNSFGFLDRGQALDCLERFGWDLQDRVRDLCRDRYFGELLVGDAAIVPTESTPAWMLYAPIARTTSRGRGSLAPYLAARATFMALRKHNESRSDSPIRRLALAVFGAEDGLVHPLIAARQIRYAYQIAAGLRGFGDKNLSQLARREQKLASMPASEGAEDADA